MDGFWTLPATTRTQFAVVRDSFACKPAVIAETDDYVAMASEYQALAGLPGITDARVFEPMPEEIHVWTPVILSCADLSTREINTALAALPDGACARVLEPRGRHNLAVGLSNRVRVDIEGNAGYYIGGLGQGPDVVVSGFVGWSVGENLQAGSVRVRGKRLGVRGRVQPRRDDRHRG